MLVRARKLQHALVGRLPYSRARGCRALAEGRGEEWIKAAELAGARLDVAAGLLLLLSAATALAALVLMSPALGIVGVLSMAGALFSMAGTMWVDKQVGAVYDHAHLFKP